MPAIHGLIDKYIFRKHETPPPISTTTAVGLLALYTFVYVAPFYLSALTRPSPTLSRDAPSVIRARIASVTLSCAACSLATFVLLTTAGGEPGVSRLSAADALHGMGWWPAGVAEALRALLLTAALFAGPLFEQVAAEEAWRGWAWTWRSDLADWTVWRNLVAGPVTEEVLFRAAAVPLLVLARTPVGRTVLLSPVVFGLAHCHHAYEFAVAHPRVPWAAVALRSLVQFAYTTLFGAYATFVFLRTGSLLAVVAAHSFCNCMGLPRVWGRVQRPDGSAPLLWTAAYYVLLVAGAVFWYQHLWSLTESPRALAKF